MYPTRDEGASESFRRSVKFFNWYVPRPAPVAEVGLVDEFFRKRREARKKMLAEDVEEEAENCSNLRTVSIMERVEIIQEMCGSLLKLPAEVDSLKGRIHKLESVIHVSILIQHYVIVHSLKLVIAKYQFLTTFFLCSRL